MSLDPNIISLINTCPNIIFENICPHLRPRDLGNLLLVREIFNSFKEYFKEYPKGLDNFKEKILTNSVMHATREEIPVLFTNYFRRNNALGLKVLLRSGRLREYELRGLNLLQSLSGAIENDQKEILATFIKFACVALWELAFTKAASHGYRNILEVLMDSERFAEISKDILGVAFATAASRHQSILELFMNSESFIEINTDFFCLAFMEAASHGYRDVVEDLMNSGRFAEIDTDTLEVAFTKAALHGYRDVVEVLMSSERFIEISTDFFALAFMEAASHGYRDVVEVLMNSGRFTEIDTDILEVALIKAALHGYRDVVEVLMNFERFSEISSEVLQSAVTEAVSHGHRDVVEVLMSCERFSRNAIYNFN